MALSKTTQDHDEIRQWAESRGAVPAEVASTETEGQTGILRIEFPKAKNANDSALKEISWDEFFEKFDASGLALVYQEQTAEGVQSNFNKLIYPENSKAAPASKSSGRKAPAKKASSQAVAKGKSGPKKSAGVKAAEKSAPAKSAKKASAKKVAAKKTAPKAAPKAAPKKPATTKAPAKKSAAKKKTASKRA